MQIEKRIQPSSQLDEVSYRKLKGHLNYSAVRQYITNRPKFVKEHIMGMPVEKEETLSTIVGSMVHTLLAAVDGEFDSKYVMSSCQVPAGQMGELCDTLYKRALKSLNEEGVQTESFETIFLDAVNTVKYDYNMVEKAFKGKTVEKIIELFTKDGEQYYKELLNNTGKTVVTEGSIRSAEKIVEQLRTHPFTRDVVNIQSQDGIDVFNELCIIWEREGMPCKSMVDKLIINHDDKTVKPIDWKTSWDDNMDLVYIKNGYYLQVAMYNQALLHWMREYKLEEYTLSPMLYVLCDTTGYSSPTQWQLSSKDVRYALNGFSIRGKKYMGLVEAMDAIKWGTETGIWSHTPEIDQKQGKMLMNVQYDII